MKKLYIISILILSSLSCADNVKGSEINKKIDFSKKNAFEYVKKQTDMGSRYYGSDAHENVKIFLKETINSFGYNSLSHNFDAPYIKNRKGENIYAFLKGKSDKYIIISTHFDSRSIAEKDPNPFDRNDPISGANDGASSTGAVLELMRVLKKYENELPYSVAFVFFDLEDDGGLFNVEGKNFTQTDWIQGSIAFASDNIIPSDQIYFGILLDMVGSFDPEFMYESYAYTKNGYLYNYVWDTAKKLGYSNYFLNKQYGVIVDDHTPFLELNIPFIDIIDMNYSYHHTQADTIDKISEDTLYKVGSLVEYIIKNTDDIKNY